MEHGMAHERKKLIDGEDRSEEPAARPARRNTGRLGKWSVLGSFCLLTSTNAFMFMNFAAVSSISQAYFKKTDMEIAMLYSMSMMTTVFAMPIIAPLVERHARSLTWSAVLFNALGGWLRWVAACRMSYDIAFGSSVMIGLAAAVIMCLNTQISEQWFAPEERAWTTTLAVQLNYAGWCLAALLTPYVVTVATDLPGFCFRQALFVSLAVVAHTASQFALIESTELPQTTGSLRSSLAEFVSLLTMAIRCRRFAVEGTLYAAMAGISMAVPAVQDDILERAGMAQVIGLVSGRFATHRSATRKIIQNLLAALFVLCAFSLTTLSLVVGVSYGKPIANSDIIFIAVLICMAGAGGSALGFMGFGLELVCETGRSAIALPAAISGAYVLFLMQIFGSALTQMCTGPYGFVICSGTAWIVVLGLVLMRRSEARAQS